MREPGSGLRMPQLRTSKGDSVRRKGFAACYGPMVYHSAGVKCIRCPYCGKDAPITNGKTLYPHRPDLFTKLFYFCEPCDAYVGCHRSEQDGGMGDGTMPLGRLANHELRKAKSEAHAAFDPLWKDGSMKRKDAYYHLSQYLKIDFRDCHIGMFDIAQCRRVRDFAREMAASLPPKRSTLWSIP